MILFEYLIYYTQTNPTLGTISTLPHEAHSNSLKRYLFNYELSKLSTTAPGKNVNKQHDEQPKTSHSYHAKEVGSLLHSLLMRHLAKSHP